MVLCKFLNPRKIETHNLNINVYNYICALKKILTWVPVWPTPSFSIWTLPVLLKLLCVLTQEYTLIFLWVNHFLTCVLPVMYRFPQETDFSSTSFHQCLWALYSFSRFYRTWLLNSSGISEFQLRMKLNSSWLKQRRNLCALETGRTRGGYRLVFCLVLGWAGLLCRALLNELAPAAPGRHPLCFSFTESGS